MAQSIVLLQSPRVICKMPDNNRPQIVIENRNILLTVNISINWGESCCPYSKVGNTAPKHTDNFTFKSLFGTTPSQGGAVHPSSSIHTFFVSTNLYSRIITKNYLSPVVFNGPVYFRPKKSKSSFSIEWTYRNFLGHRPAFET